MTTPMLVYEAALRRAHAGHDAVLQLFNAQGDRLGRIDAALWSVEHRWGDESMLRRCRGATLDVGCGSGRLVAALGRQGRLALGVDICVEAVRQARRRGALAMRGDVFEPLPMEGRWRTILLADGNIGIGGDPGRLLRRCVELLDRCGAVVVELYPPGAASWTGHIALHDGVLRSTPFPWAWVNAGDVAELAHGSSLRVADEWTEARRWFVHLVR